MTLLDIAERPYPPEPTNANLVAYVDHVRPHVTPMESYILAWVTRYFEAHPQHEDVTGGELAEWSRVSILTVRPRLHGLQRQGKLRKTASMRPSRAAGENKCHAYYMPR